MRKGLWFGLLVALVWMTCPPAMAESPFNLKELDKFLADFPGFVRFSEEQGEAIGADTRPGMWTSLKMNDEIKGFLDKKGWDFERFFYMASHVTAGLMAAEVRAQGPEIIAQMEAQMAAIANNPQIPDAMKQQLMAQMQSGMTQAGAVGAAGDDLPPQEMDLILKHKARIRKAFERAE